MIGGCYLRWVRDSLTHHLTLLETDGQSEVLAGFAKASHRFLEFLSRVSYDSCFICEQKVSQKFELRFGDGLKSGEVKQFPVRSGPQVDAFGGSAECVLEEDSKEYPEQGGGEYTSLLDSATDVEGYRS